MTNILFTGESRPFRNGGPGNQYDRRRLFDRRFPLEEILELVDCQPSITDDTAHRERIDRVRAGDSQYPLPI
jgi:hypothetical protein